MSHIGLNELFILIGLMTVVTYLPRVFPVIVLSRRRMPPLVERWLSYVPVAVLAALLAPAIFAPAGNLDFSASSNPAFWVSMPVFVMAVVTRNLFATVLTGMFLIALFRYFLA